MIAMNPLNPQRNKRLLETAGEFLGLPMRGLPAESMLSVMMSKKVRPTKNLSFSEVEAEEDVDGLKCSYDPTAYASVLPWLHLNHASTPMSAPSAPPPALRGYNSHTTNDRQLVIVLANA